MLAPTKQVAEKFRSALGEHASTLLVAVDKAEGEAGAIRSVMEPLEKFALDVVVAAPACAGLLESLEVPSSWKDETKTFSGGANAIQKDSVFLVAKPIEVLSVILNESWVGKQQDWSLRGSFA